MKIKRVRRFGRFVHNEQGMRWIEVENIRRSVVPKEGCTLPMTTGKAERIRDYVSRHKSRRG